MRRGRLSRPLSTGGFTVVRKCSDVFLSNGSTAGTVLVRDKDNNVSSIISLGTPEANPIFGGVYSVPFAMQFKLDDLAQYTDITNICDRYKITKVKLKAMYNATAITGSTVSAPYPSFMPLIKYVVDQDDDSPQTVDQLNAKMNLKAKTLSQGKLVSMSCRPKVAPAVYNGIGTAYAIPGKSEWINSGYRTVPHYGIKGYLENFVLQSNSDATSCVTFQIEYTVKVKDLQ